MRLHVDERRFSILSSHEFTALCNDLLRADADLVGLGQGAIDTTIKETDPDGGIDARVRAGPTTTSNLHPWIPAGPSAWQYKSGRLGSAQKLAKEELTKPGVIAAVDRGDVYCLATADSFGDRKRREIEAKIHSLYLARKKKPDYRVYTGSDLAAWTASRRSVATQHFDIPIGHWQTYDNWSRATRLQNPFFPDQARRDIIREIRNQVESKTRFIRVLGKAGVGKTRTALEALGLPGVRERVLYLADAANAEPDFFSYVGRNNPGDAALLVVDECTAREYQRIAELAGDLPDGVTVIGVGPHEHQVTGEFLLLDRMGDEELAQIVESLAPGLGRAQVTMIARRCGGFPKLVVFVAEEIARIGAELDDWRDLEESASVVDFLNTKVFPIDEVAPENRLMRAISLFSRLGWTHELEPEGRAVCAFFGLEWGLARDVASQLEARGIVSRRGRFLYPTPEILANCLTRETIRTRDPGDLKRLYDSLPESARQAFAERLRELGSDLATRDVMKAVLGEEGLFTKPEDLNDPGRAQLLRLLAPSFPEEILARLDRVLRTASREELRDLDRGRRDVMWALEGLAWREEHFETAARLVLRLAWAENETYGNNATGIWRQFFQVVLGGTETPFERRTPLLLEALGDHDPSVRLLGVAALSSALQLRQISRFGREAEEEGHGQVREWQPTTKGDWKQIILTSLAQLVRSMQDPDPGVRQAAIGVLGERCSDLVIGGFVGEWAEAAGRLVGQPFDARKKILEPLRILLYEVDALEERQREILVGLESRLKGDSFEDRLRIQLASPDPAWRKGEARDFSGLAQDAVRAPQDLEDNLDFLYSGEAQSAYSFGRALAGADPSVKLLPRLVRFFIKDGGDDRLITGYVSVLLEDRGYEWGEELLDEWSAEGYGLLVATVTWRLVRSGRAAKRLANLIATGAVSGGFLRNLTFGFWARELPAESVATMLEAAAKDASIESVRAQLQFVDQYVRENATSISVLGVHARRLLREGIGVALGTMDLHAWKDLALQQGLFTPIQLAQLCVDGIEKRAGSIGSERVFQEVLNTVLRASAAPERRRILEEVVGPSILRDTRMLWALDDVFEGRSLLGLFDVEDVVRWIKEDVPKRLHVVAHCAPVGHEEVSPLARRLLETWGETEEVRAGLAATFGTGSWSGSESVYLNDRLTTLKRWAADPNRNVARWALELSSYYEKRLAKARLLEEEEGT